MCFTTCQCLSCMQENGSSFIACIACTIRFVLVYLCFYQSYNGFLGFVWAYILHVSLLAIGFFTWHSFYSEFPDNGGSLGFCYLSSISNFIFGTFFLPLFFGCYLSWKLFLSLLKQDLGGVLLHLQNKIKLRKRGWRECKMTRKEERLKIR